MSGLAAVLAGRKDPGIYLWHGQFDPADVRHTVEHAGWHFVHLDGWLLNTKAEFLEAVGEAFSFPDYYGKNFDSLEDCLRDVKAGDASGIVFLWDGWSPLARSDERAFKVALGVLSERVEESQFGRFAVLLRGEGPALPDVPSID